jgi:hypothetical protein
MFGYACQLMKGLFYIFIIIIIASCGFPLPENIRDKFTYCYDSANTGIETKLNTQGFFRFIEIEKNHDSIIHEYTTVNAAKVLRADTHYTDLMFFRDGIVGSTIGFVKASQDNKYNVANFTIETQDTIVASYYWGRYVLNGDTIVAQMVHSPGVSLSDTWYGYEEKFLIISKDSIFRIGHTNFNPENDIDSIKYYSELAAYGKFPSGLSKTGKFYPVNKNIKSYVWLKKKEWFRCKPNP